MMTEYVNRKLRIQKIILPSHSYISFFSTARSFLNVPLSGSSYLTSPSLCFTYFLKYFFSNFLVWFYHLVEVRKK